ncbi:MAG TPA: hypothetical protein VF168_00775 [Trueperaceae bacterium]
MSVTLLGPRWTGKRLSLLRPSELGLDHGDLVGWSDFYGGGPCHVNVACASDGRNSGYLVWGGTLGLRLVPEHVVEIDRQLGDILDSRSVLWVKDAANLPPEVRQVVEIRPPAGDAEGSRHAGNSQEFVAAADW